MYDADDDVTLDDADVLPDAWVAVGRGAYDPQTHIHTGVPATLSYDANCKRTVSSRSVRCRLTHRRYLNGALDQVLDGQFDGARSLQVGVDDVERHVGKHLQHLPRLRTSHAKHRYISV